MKDDDLTFYSLPDGLLGDEEDRALRALLSLCFTGPGDAVFLERRYFLEPPEERWFLREKGGRLVAHAGLRLRPVRSAQGDFPVGGISEVCVHPDHRGRGHVRRILTDIHHRLRSLEVDFALLFGEGRIYASSGYVGAENDFCYWNPQGFRWVKAPVPTALVCELASARWPEGTIDMRGILF